nr:glycosyltransferase family 2 protein [Anaerolineae bacterium]
MEATETVDLSIIIVSWNVAALLHECLVSVKSNLRTTPEIQCEIIVVDNASSDESVQTIREKHPDVALLTLEENTGYGRANNLCFGRSSGQAILILNPDTVVLENAFDMLLTYLNQHQEIGVIGPKLLNADQSVQSSRRRFPTLRTAIFESTWLEPIAPRRLLNRYYMQDIDPDIVTPVDWLQGTALLVRREAFEVVKGFDEAFFMYFEEIDLQKRIKEAGWEIVYYPPARIIHYGGKSSDQVVARRHIYFQSSKVRYFSKHHGQLIGMLVWTFIMLSYLWQLILEMIKWAIGHKRAMRKERLRAYCQVIRSGLRG